MIWVMLIWCFIALGWMFACWAAYVKIGRLRSDVVWLEDQITHEKAVRDVFRELLHKERRKNVQHQEVTHDVPERIQGEASEGG